MGSPGRFLVMARTGKLIGEPQAIADSLEPLFQHRLFAANFRAAPGERR